MVQVLSARLGQLFRIFQRREFTSEFFFAISALKMPELGFGLARDARSSRRLGSEAPMMFATGRSSGSRLFAASLRLPECARIQWHGRAPGRLQRRPRNGFAPFSLLSPA